MARIHVPIALTVALALFGCSHVALRERSPPAPTPWPHEVSDLKPDPAVVWGRLENGLRYAILPRDLPHGRISVCLLVQAGSYHEADDQPLRQAFVNQGPRVETFPCFPKRSRAWVFVFGPASARQSSVKA